MKKIVVHDKTFVESIPEARLLEGIHSLAARISADYEGQDMLFVPILNGAYMFAADLVRALDIDPEVQFMRLSSYGGGMSSSGTITPMLDLECPVEGRHVLLVEDIVDTGNTLQWLREYFMDKGAASVRMACLLFKKEVFQKEVPPAYFCFEIPNQFVVGYGLDYAERGRRYRSIYTLES